jgi:aldose 1-epimerase
MSPATEYSAHAAVIDGVDAVKLGDAAGNIEVTVLPGFGNIACRMLVNGKNILWTPSDNLAQWKASLALGGVPFLWPWANRIDQDAYYVDGKKYLLNPDLGNLRRDGNQKSIHGLLLFTSRWRVIAIEADSSAAWVTSRLEFSKYPDLMAQFPFAHTVEMTHRLAGGVLEVETAVRNESMAAMPVVMGFHPYYRIHDALRDEWRVHIGARDRMTLSATLIPTGERTPAGFPDLFPLRGVQLDDVFTNLESGFSVEGEREKISISFGPKFTEAVIYAPPGKSFICFEPMSGTTNAFNLAHAGIYKGLQSIAPGGEWRESFRISTSGF